MVWVGGAVGLVSRAGSLKTAWIQIEQSLQSNNTHHSIAESVERDSYRTYGSSSMWR
jgi:hypothetical protein